MSELRLFHQAMDAQQRALLIDCWIILLDAHGFVDGRLIYPTLSMDDDDDELKNDDLKDDHNDKDDHYLAIKDPSMTPPSPPTPPLRHHRKLIFLAGLATGLRLKGRNARVTAAVDQAYRRLNDQLPDGSKHHLPPPPPTFVLPPMPSYRRRAHQQQPQPQQQQQSHAAGHGPSSFGSPFAAASAAVCAGRSVSLEPIPENDVAPMVRMMTQHRCAQSSPSLLQTHHHDQLASPASPSVSVRSLPGVIPSAEGEHEVPATTLSSSSSVKAVADGLGSLIITTTTTVISTTTSTTTTTTTMENDDWNAVDAFLLTAALRAKNVAFSLELLERMPHALVLDLAVPLMGEALRVVQDAPMVDMLLRFYLFYLQPSRLVEVDRRMPLLELVYHHAEHHPWLEPVVSAGAGASASVLSERTFIQERNYLVASSMMVEEPYSFDRLSRFTFLLQVLDPHAHGFPRVDMDHVLHQLLPHLSRSRGHTSTHGHSPTHGHTHSHAHTHTQSHDHLDIPAEIRGALLVHYRTLTARMMAGEFGEPGTRFVVDYLMEKGQLPAHAFSFLHDEHEPEHEHDDDDDDDDDDDLGRRSSVSVGSGTMEEQEREQQATSGDSTARRRHRRHRRRRHLELAACQHLSRLLMESQERAPDVLIVYGDYLSWLLRSEESGGSGSGSVGEEIVDTRPVVPRLPPPPP